MNGFITNFVPVIEPLADRPALACPICGHSTVHPVGLECRSPGTGKGQVLIDCNGIHLDPQQEPIGRGVMITLSFACEAGHAFEYELHFHEGSTFLCRRMQDLPNDPEKWPETIWRD